METNTDMLCLSLAGEDFEAITNLQVTFAPSETRQEVSVVILNDDRTEVTSESVLYSVTSANPRVRTSGEPGFFRIIDDDRKHRYSVHVCSNDISICTCTCTCTCT